MSGSSAPPANTTTATSHLTDPARLPYYTNLWDQTMKLQQARLTPTANPYSVGDMTPLGGGPVSSWTDRNGKAMTVGSTGPIDWSKYFGNDVKNPYSPAYLSANPAAQYQYQGAPGTVTDGQIVNPTLPGTTPADIQTAADAKAKAADVATAAQLTPPATVGNVYDGSFVWKAGGSVNPFAEGGPVRHFDNGGATDTGAASGSAAPTFDPSQLMASAQSGDTANAQGVSDFLAQNNLSNDPAGINAGIALYNQQNPGANLNVQDVGAAFGKDSTAATNWMSQPGNHIGVTPQVTSNAATTANKLSSFTGPANTASPYQTTSYTPVDYAASTVSPVNAQANSMAKPEDAQAASMQTVDNAGTNAVSTGAFTDPGTVQNYMNPYQQAATDVEIRQAQHNAAIAKTGADAQAQQAGAFGGYRQGVQAAETAKNEAQLEANIQAQGSAAAYAAAQQAYQADAARQLQAGTTNAANTLTSNLANQQAGLTTNIQNLTAEQQTRLANLGMAVQVGQSNLTAAQQTALANQQTAMTAQQANQAAGLSANAQNIQNRQAAAGIAQTSQAQNAQYSLQSQLANQQAAFQTAGVQQSAANTNAQLALAQLQNDTTQRAQDLNMSQFQTNTSMAILSNLQTQYGAIQNWPLDQLKAALASISVGG